MASLQEYLPRLGFGETLATRIRSVLRQHLGASFSFDLQSVTTLAPGAVTPFLEGLPRPGIYPVIGLVPTPEKALAEVDMMIAHVMIDRLLGGSGEPLAMIRPLTEIEKGVFSYLVLKVLQVVFEQCGRSARVHFRLEGIRESPLEGEQVVARAGEGAVFLTYRLFVGDRSGFLRLILPTPFVQRGFLEGGGKGRMDEDETTEILMRLAHLGYLETDLRAEVGRTVVKPRDLGRLEPGDVVLLDEASVTLAGNGGGVTGRAVLRVGRGTHGSFWGKIVGTRPLQVVLEGVGREQPVPKMATPPARKKGKK